jgi:hypothetical protein
MNVGTDGGCLDRQRDELFFGGYVISAETSRAVNKPEPFGPTVAGVAIRKIYLGLVTIFPMVTLTRPLEPFTDGSESDATVC